MNNSDIKRQILKNKTSKIIQRDKRDNTLENLIHNYSKDNIKTKRKELLSKEEFFDKLI